MSILQVVLGAKDCVTSHTGVGLHWDAATKTARHATCWRVRTHDSPNAATYWKTAQNKPFNHFSTR